MRRRSAFCLLVIAALAFAASAAAQDTLRTDAGAQEVRGTCPSGTCPMNPPSLITGVLGSCGDWPACTSGVQTGRLNRNGIASSCASPKTCQIFDNTPGRAFDAYTINNDTGATACVTMTLDVQTQADCNLQLNAYLNSYDPASICTGYLADPGGSSGIPPNPVGPFCADVPADDDLILVVHTTNPGEIDCDYTITLTGDCIPVELMDFNVTDN